MTRHEYDVRDPAQLVHDISERVVLTEGTAHLALVADVSRTQRVVRVDTLATPAEIFDDDSPREELREIVETWSIPWVRGKRPTHTPVLVVVRRGLCVFGPNESMWLTADRYANHLADLWTMQLILVTEHGWLDFMTYDAGTTPALVPAPSPVT
jgi:hypothetical protein